MDVLEGQEVISDLSYSPSTEDSDAISLSYIFSQMMNKYKWITPAIVKEYNRKSNIVTAQPAMQEMAMNNEAVTLCEIDVPCYVAGGGGWVTSYPLKKGDTGWLLTNDRDISEFLSTKQVSKPNTYRKHDYADSVFLPDFISGFMHKSEDDNAVVLQNKNGNIKVAIDDSSMRITFANTQVVINKDGINITAKEAQVTADNIKINGNVSVDGQLLVTGDIQSNRDVTASGISLKTHVHGDVESGNSTTGEPQ